MSRWKVRDSFSVIFCSSNFISLGRHISIVTIRGRNAVVLIKRGRDINCFVDKINVMEPRLVDKEF